MTRSLHIAALLLLAACQRDKDPGADTSDGASASGCAVSRTTDGSEISLSAGDCAQTTLSPTALGEGSLSVTFTENSDGSFTPTVTAGTDGGTFEALALRGDASVAGAAPARLWRQGYQSWWFSGVVESEPITLDDRGLPEVGGDGDGISAVEETPFTSWWVGLLGRSDGHSLLIGALSSTRTRFYVAASEDEVWAVWGGRDESIALAGGESLTLDPLWIDAGDDAFDLHRTYAAAAAAHVGVAPRTDTPHTGWATWTVYYAEVTEDDVRANLAVAASLGLELLQLDDGWQEHWGDWTANEKFPSGMDGLAADIAAAGMIPGLWMAPFYVDQSTPAYKENADWWVLDDAGEPITFSNFGAGNFVILDVTHPDAASWMQDQIRTRVDEGWTYLKLDFLYAGAQAGQRQQDVTGMEAYQIGMELLREAAGDAFILACGAPMLPSLGTADAFRTGADIAFNFDPDPVTDYLRWQTRATAARSWGNGLWWWVDPDQMQLREPYGETEVTGALAANAASGGAWLLGDGLDTLDSDLLALGTDADLLALRGAVGEPLDPLAWPSGLDAGPVSERTSPDDQVPPVWELSSGETVLVNFFDEEITVEGPGGTELISGATAEAGTRTLAPGAGEIWRPAR